MPPHPVKQCLGPCCGGRSRSRAWLEPATTEPLAGLQCDAVSIGVWHFARSLYPPLRAVLSEQLVGFPDEGSHQDPPQMVAQAG